MTGRLKRRIDDRKSHQRAADTNQAGEILFWKLIVADGHAQRSLVSDLGGKRTLDASRYIAMQKALLLLTLMLGGCGDYLGEYRLERVRLVDTVPLVARYGMNYPRSTKYLRIEVSSNVSLYAANTGPGLYADVDYCPLNNPDRMIAFGPLAADDKAVESWKRNSILRPDSGDRRYHYFVYVAASSAARKLFMNSTDEIPAYDLRRPEDDVCLRFHVPGYNIIPSRSDKVKVPARDIEAAVRDMPAS